MPEPLSMLSFSAGQRSCVGKQLALTQIRIFLVVVFKKYDIRIIDEGKKMVFKEFANNITKVRFFIR